MSEPVAMPVAGTAEAAPAGPVVEAHELTRRYGEGDTAVDALRGVGLEVARGRLTRAEGPSCSGTATPLPTPAPAYLPDRGYGRPARPRLVALGGTELARRQ